jgi:hypothetical protein
VSGVRPVVLRDCFRPDDHPPITIGALPYSGPARSYRPLEMKKRDSISAWQLRPNYERSCPVRSQCGPHRQPASWAVEQVGRGRQVERLSELYKTPVLRSLDLMFDALEARVYGERLRGCSPRNMNVEKAQGLSPELQAALEPLLAAIESLSVPAPRVYAPRYREEWLSKIAQAGVRRVLDIPLYRSGVAVEKVPQQNSFSSASGGVAGFLVSVQLSGGRQNRYCRLTEKAHQSLEVLSYRCQEELLAHEPESPQTQAPQSDLILQFREQGFHFLSLPNAGTQDSKRSVEQSTGTLTSPTCRYSGTRD